MSRVFRSRQGVRSTYVNTNAVVPYCTRVEVNDAGCAILDSMNDLESILSWLVSCSTKIILC